LLHPFHTLHSMHSRWMLMHRQMNLECRRQMKTDEDSRRSDLSRWPLEMGKSTCGWRSRKGKWAEFVASE
jgi:hypothetical protein